MTDKNKALILFGIVIVAAVVLGAINYTDKRKAAEQWKECWRQASQEPRQGPLTVNGATAVRNNYDECLRNTPGVIGSGIGACQEEIRATDDGPCIRIYVLEEEFQGVSRVIPPVLEGYRTYPFISGPIEAF